MPRLAWPFSRTRRGCVGSWLELALQQRDLLGQRIAFPSQLACFLHDAGELFFVTPGEPSVLGGVGGQSMDITDELFVTLLGFGECALGTPLRVACFLGLHHHPLLHAFEPRGRLIDFRPQGGFMFRPGGPQRLKFARMRGLRIAQGLFQLRAYGIPFGGGGFALPCGCVTLGLSPGDRGERRSKTHLMVVKLCAQSMGLGLKSRVGGDKRIGACCGGRRFGLEFFASLPEDLFAMFDRKRPNREHRTGDCRWQRGAQRVDARLFVLPQLQFVVDRRTAALTDLCVDQVDGQVVWPATRRDEAGGRFTGADTGIADTAHGWISP